jgi:hypothetical protein
VSSFSRFLADRHTDRHTDRHDEANISIIIFERSKCVGIVQR